MKRAIKLVVIGFVIALAGLLIAIFAHGIAGAVIFFIGWLICATVMLMVMWKNSYLTSHRFIGIGTRIVVIGGLIFFLGALLEVPESMETLSNILVKGGLYIVYAGFFVCFLVGIEENMR